MEKITDKQVKKVEVIYDCSEFSRDTYTVKGYSATFHAERWDDNRYLARYDRFSEAVSHMLQHLSVEDCDLIKDLICGQNEDYELLEGEGSSEEYGSSDDDESFEQLREKLDDEGEDLNDAWLDEHGKAIEAVSQILSPYAKKLDIEFIEGNSEVIKGYDNLMEFAKSNQ